LPFILNDKWWQQLFAVLYQCNTLVVQTILKRSFCTPPPPLLVDREGGHAFTMSLGTSAKSVCR
jgi:hypothetical protein